MGTFYTVAQYVPDPIADERINFGVIVFGGGKVISRFTSQWKRLSKFGLEPDIGYLKEFIEYVESASLPLFMNFEGQQRISEERIQIISKEWNGSIRLTTPKASLHDHDTLIKRISALMLRNIERQEPTTGRTKVEATTLAIDALRSAILRVTGIQEAAYSLVQKRVGVEGGLDQHTCDIAIQNGHLMHGIWTVSFDVDDRRRTDSDVKRAAWAIDDIKRLTRGPEFSVVALRPQRDEPSAFMKAGEMFKKLGAQFVHEDGVTQWARELAMSTAKQTGLPLKQD